MGMTKLGGSRASLKVVSTKGGRWMERYATTVDRATKRPSSPMFGPVNSPVVREHRSPHRRQHIRLFMHKMAEWMMQSMQILWDMPCGCALLSSASQAAWEAFGSFPYPRQQDFCPRSQRSNLVFRSVPTPSPSYSQIRIEQVDIPDDLIIIQ